MKKENWEKEFRKRFNNERTQLYEYSQKLGTYNSCGNSVEFFISQKLQAQKEKYEQILDKWIEDKAFDIKDAVEAERKRIIEIIEKEKEKIFNSKDFYDGNKEEIFGLLSKIISKINQL